MGYVGRIKQILILYTGGTIGMDYLDGMLQIIPGLFKSQLEMLVKSTQVKLELIEYKNLIDSSDITTEHWQQMIDDINVNYNKFDGFVIVHGTDTMAYTASVLSFALQGLSKPVILTGAQLPLVHLRSDGWNNLIDSLYAASQDDLCEVVIVFNHTMLRGSRAQKISTNKFLGFDSVDEEPLATFGINIEWHKKRWLKHQDRSFVPIKLKTFKVLDISLRPGFTTEFIGDTLLNTKLDGVILQTYGSGNFPIHNKRFMTGLRHANDVGVIIVNITQVIEGRVTSDYINSQLPGFGVVNGCDMTPEAALAKLNVLLSSGKTLEVIKLDMVRNLVGELTESNF